MRSWRLWAPMWVLVALEWCSNVRLDVSLRVWCWTHGGHCTKMDSRGRCIWCGARVRSSRG